jgi:adenylate cyclase
VKDNIGNRLDLQFEDMGKQRLKNIAEPVQLYQVRPLAFKTPKVTAALSRDKSSIAVLPFVNLSGDTESEAFADGLTEDIITALSYCGNLLVIARTSVFAYKGKTGDVKRIGQELDVTYVMEGSVRRSMDRVRVTAQLIEAATGHHVWAEKYDGKLENIFDIQDEITRAVAASTNAQVYLAAWHARRRHAPGTDRAHALASAAIGRMLDTTAEAFLEGTKLADEAFEANPDLPITHFARTFAFLFRLGEGIVPHTPEAIAQGLDWADEVLRRAPNDENSHWIKGWALAEAGRMSEAVTECEIAVSINPNVPMLLGDLGLFSAALGNAEDAIQASKLAIRISPRDPAIIWRRYTIAYAQFILEQHEDVCLEMRRIAQSNKGFTRAGLLWAASAAALGKMDEASTAIRHCLAERPQLRIGNFAPQYMLAYVQPQHQTRLVGLLRKAGLPE